jgi:hypothetical protein
MSAITRQSDLFAGESWTVLYNAFTNINFNATDPVSINQALQDYIRINYPEQFNDWIVESEFVAIIDLLSWLAGTLAFKIDLAARENFIDVAEAKESILRLARFLSYNSNRCQPATGVVKITAISTDDDVTDSFGIGLANTSITWNDPNNPNWQDQFTAILNNALVATNPFGIPISDGTVGGVATQLYRLNGLANNTSLGFSSEVSGVSMDFEICNGDFSDGGTLFERNPKPTNAFQFFYLNDGKGNSSNRTGFFLLFKQGSTSKQIFSVTVPVENQLLNIGSVNVNQNDVWVQTVDDQANVLIQWTKVPAIFNSNITYNSVPITERNIFSVLTRDADQITIRFSDGRFGNAPTGNIQVVYRVSNGLSYQIKPLEISDIQLQYSYTNGAGATKSLTVAFSLYESVTNASATETVEQIRQRSPQVYGTQGRMVSGEDYNTFPLSTNLAVKIKAVNRVYSGQSRYIDLHEPTGNYQDLSIFSEDGVFFRDNVFNYVEVPSTFNKTSQEIIAGYIQPFLTQYTVSNMIRDVLLQNTKYITTTDPVTTWSSGTSIDVSSLGYTWTTANANLFQTTGWFSHTLNLIQPGAIIQFMIAGVPTWIPVIDIEGPINMVPATNTAGPVTLGQEVPTGSVILAVLPTATVGPSSSVLTQMESNIDLHLSFSLWYDYSNSNSVNGPTYIINPPANDFGAPEPGLVGNAIQIMNVNYITGLWRITLRGLRFVFESIAKVQWFENGKRALAQYTAEANPDLIRVMRINRNLNDIRGYALEKDFNLLIDRMWTYPDGNYETRRTTVLFQTTNDLGYPTIPDTYYQLVSSSTRENFLFWANTANPPYVQPLYTVKAYDTDLLRAADTPAIGTVGFQVTSSVSYLYNETFWLFTSSGWVQDLSNTYTMHRGRGPNIAQLWVTSSGTTTTDGGDEIVFHWKHYAPSDHRIDPASTNINDIFVLTFSYDIAIRQWIAQGAVLDKLPLPPTELDLSIAFSALEQFKMFSDTIIWRPVKYKFLFGNGANPELVGQFKIVRLANSSVSDGEIRSRVINSINTYFSASNWDFGETFYFTELAAYIHQQLVGLIGSVVLVPTAGDTAFGDGFEVSCNPDELFISTAQVSDVVIINSNTAVNLRIKNG